MASRFCYSLLLCISLTLSIGPASKAGGFDEAQITNIGYPAWFK